MLEMLLAPAHMQISHHMSIFLEESQNIHAHTYISLCAMYTIESSTHPNEQKLQLSSGSPLQVCRIT